MRTHANGLEVKTTFITHSRGLLEECPAGEEEAQHEKAGQSQDRGRADYLFSEASRIALAASSPNTRHSRSHTATSARRRLALTSGRSASHPEDVLQRPHSDFTQASSRSWHSPFTSHVSLALDALPGGFGLRTCDRLQSPNASALSIHPRTHPQNRVHRVHVSRL